MRANYAKADPYDCIEVTRARNAKCADGLLARLKQHHCFDVPAPKITIVRIVEKPVSWAEQQIQVWMPASLSAPRHLQVRDVQKAVCQYFNVKFVDLVSQRRKMPVTRARQIAMWLSRELTTRSYPEIGVYFGGRDHTTVIHAFRKIDGLRASDPKLKSDSDELLNILERKRDEINSGRADQARTGDDPQNQDQFPASKEAVGEAVRIESNAAVEG